MSELTSRSSRRTRSRGYVSRMQERGVSRELEVIAEFADAWPSGIAVSRSGRIFVSFPRLEEPRAAATLAEVRSGKAYPFPDELSNDTTAGDKTQRFTSIHGVAMAPANRLFALDTGSNTMDGCDPAAAALYLIDLDHDAIVRRYTFGHGVVLGTSYLKDVVIEYGRGESGTAYISDCGPAGPNGIIVVDLDTGRSWRRLSGHSSVRGAAAGAGFSISAEGETLAPTSVGIDGLALSPDGKTLWWTPLGSYGLYRMPTDALADTTRSDEEVERAVETLPGRDFACDGLDCDREGRIYFSDVTNNAVQRLIPGEMRYETILQDARLVWPDAVALGPDRIIYVTSSQTNRAPEFAGVDRRERPYRVFRAASDADPAGY